MEKGECRKLSGRGCASDYFAGSGFFDPYIVDGRRPPPLILDFGLDDIRPAGFGPEVHPLGIIGGKSEIIGNLHPMMAGKNVG